MSARSRSKPRRRDVTSHRYYHELFGNCRKSTHRAVTSAVPVKSVAEAPHVAPRPNPRRVENKNTMRFEGDSIAYFWALETETALSYEMLTVHWREFADALTKSWGWG